MKVTKIQTVLSEIQNVIFSSQGQGFTVELDPEITKCYEYEPKFNLLSKEPYSWRHRWWDEGTLSQQELLSVHSGWGYSLPQDIVNMLPLGVSLKKTEIQVLLDTRKGKPTRNTLHNAKYAEGRRVYLMVTDEYAQQVFKNTYSNVGHIFRDHLLNEQSVLLKKIVNEYIHVTEHNGIERCFLGITPQGITTCSWFSFSSDDDWSNYIKFEHMGKLDLKNVGEQLLVHIFVLTSDIKHVALNFVQILRISFSFQLTFLKTILFISCCPFSRRWVKYIQKRENSK